MDQIDSKIAKKYESLINPIINEAPTDKLESKKALIGLKLKEEQKQNEEDEIGLILEDEDEILKLLPKERTIVKESTS